MTSTPPQVPDDTLGFLNRLNAQQAEREASRRREQEAAATRAEEARRQREAHEASIREARRKSEADVLRQQLGALEARIARLSSPLTPPAQVAPVPHALPPSAAVADPAQLEDEDDADVEGDEGVDDEVDEDADDEVVAASGSGWGILTLLGLGVGAALLFGASPPAGPSQP